jgi:hypothetical protein
MPLSPNCSNLGFKFVGLEKSFHDLFPHPRGPLMSAIYSWRSISNSATGSLEQDLGFPAFV